MHRRVLFETRHDEVHEAFEAASLTIERELVRFVPRPDGVERAIRLEDAEQVVEPLVEGKRISLDVEEQVARRGRRQRGEPTLELDLLVWRRQEQLVLQP